MSTAQAPPATDLAIDLRGLTRRFGDTTAVNGVSYQVYKGDLFALLGSDGAGKSTTIRMLCGLLTPSGGSATVLGYDIATQGEELKPHIGYVSQRFGLYQDLTIQENIELMADLYGLPSQGLKERLATLIRGAGLNGRENQLAGYLSGGWKQRLALSCARIHDPPLIFLDEPTAGVDPVARREFWELLYGLARSGVTIMVATQYMDEAEYCNRVALMSNGQLIALDTPTGLKKNNVRGTLLEVDCADSALAEEVLLGVPGVKAATYGTLVHVLLDPSQDADVVTRTLAGADIAVHGMRPIEPTLEDVFVSLLS